MAPSESVPVFLPFPGTDHTPPSSPSNTQGKLLVMMLVEVVVVVVAAEVVVLDVVVEVEDLEIFLSPDKMRKYVQMQQQKD